MSTDLNNLTIGGVSALIRAQKISPVEIVDNCLNRIANSNEKINAFITVLADEAKEQARIADAEIRAGNWRGPLHGIPVGIKDFYDTAGVRTTAAFTYFKNRVPKKDAEGVSRLKHAGAIIIGKTNMHQLGMGTTGLESHFGAVHNPWNDLYIPGGSSSGSAAAVASGLCYATLDTDAIGSCRLPAACCGVVGCKGTYGLVSPAGILEGEQPPDEIITWLGHAAITTRSVADTALVLDVLATKNNPTNVDRFSARITPPRNIRVGRVENFTADHAIKNSFINAVNKIQELGYSIIPCTAPFGDPFEGIQNIQNDRASVAQRTFRDIDILVLPTTTTGTLTVEQAKNNPQALSPENTAFANYYGLPAITVPCGFDDNGLPIGLQFIGKPWDDATVLHLAHQFHAATAQTLSVHTTRLLAL